MTNAEMRKAFGQRLRSARRAAGYETARSFAADIGVQEDALSLYELGQRRPPNDVLLRIKERTGVTADYLFFGHTAGLPVSLYNKLRDG